MISTKKFDKIWVYINLKSKMELDLKYIEKTIYDLETNYLEETS